MFPTVGPQAPQPMRFDGVLVEWSDAYGCGLIQADQGGDPLVVEASAFVDDAGRPRQGQALSFEIRLSEAGHKEAVEVRRARADAPRGLGVARPPGTARPVAAPQPSGRGVGPVRRLLGVIALAGVGFVGVQAWQGGGGIGFGQFLAVDEPDEGALAGDAVETTLRAVEQGRVAPAAAADVSAPRESLTQATSTRCDGRTKCSQMRSCAEARWFLQNCPGTEMDGDGDGIPCEQQWCSAR